ncbi:MAG TPA: zf-HC2 domain-containing protein [Pyrinomonadaceae bacterium]|nr:zf-HC2 domain-containing protein [Pyrinomonadaceae bacterium]
MTTAQEKFCETSLIAAYVDGELDEDLELRFEEHVQSCEPCRVELRLHRLFICELDATLTETDVPMPRDFSRIIAARATSDMRGVRTRAEHRKALGISMILALIGFALLGATARETVFRIAESFVTTVAGLVSFAVTAVYDTVAGLAVIFRVLSRKLIVESGSLGPVVVLLAVAIVLLSRLLSKYHRTSATE